MRRDKCDGDVNDNFFFDDEATTGVCTGWFVAESDVYKGRDNVE